MLLKLRWVVNLYTKSIRIAEIYPQYKLCLYSKSEREGTIAVYYTSPKSL